MIPVLAPLWALWVWLPKPRLGTPYTETKHKQEVPVER